MSGCFTRILQICLALIGLLLIFIFVRFLATNRANTVPEQTAAPRVIVTSSAPPINGASAIAGGATAVPFAVVMADGAALSFNALCNNTETLTKLQREGLAASMADKQIVGWTGTVFGIEPDGEDAKVLVDMSEDTIAAREVVLTGVSRSLASTLHSDQQIRFDGTIQQILLGVETICDPIVIVDAEITSDP